MAANPVDKALKKLEAGQGKIKSISLKLKEATVESLDIIVEKTGVSRDELVDEILASSGVYSKAKQLGGKA